MTEEERAIYYQMQEDYKYQAEEKRKEIAEYLENYKPKKI